MPSYITFNKINTKYLIYPIIAIITLIIENYLLECTSFFNNIYDHTFVNIICKSSIQFLCLIPFLIIKIKKEKSTKKNKIETTENNKLIQNKEYLENIKNIKARKYPLIIFNSFINFLYLTLLFNYYFDKFLSLWIFDIIHVSILSYFILNKKYYKHQYFSIIVICIFGLILNVINLYDEEINYIRLLITFFLEILYSLNIVLNKYLMENLFCSHLELVIYEWSFNFILALIFLSISTNIDVSFGDIKYKNKSYFDNFYHYYDEIDKKEIFAFICLSIINFTIYLCYLLTYRYYTVFHFFIILIFDECDFYTHVFRDWRLYVNIIIYICFLLMVFVFNENIVLNFFGLEKNTKKNISKRAINDYPFPNQENKVEGTDKELYDKPSNEIELDIGPYKVSIDSDSEKSE